MSTTPTPTSELGNGPVTFFDLPVADAAKGRAFWGGLFGWRFMPGNFPGYDMIDGSSPYAGLDSTSGGGPIRVYFDVPDVEAARTRVVELGGEAGEAIQLPSGTMARCTDDQGTEFTLWRNA
ncbi:MAG: VOC family protein [Phycicoccus sp.]